MIQYLEKMDSFTTPPSSPKSSPVAHFMINNGGSSPLQLDEVRRNLCSEFNSESFPNDSDSELNQDGFKTPNQNRRVQLYPDPRNPPKKKITKRRYSIVSVNLFPDI